jgi:hypothetical protein
MNDFAFYQTGILAPAKRRDGCINGLQKDIKKPVLLIPEETSV